MKKAILIILILLTFTGCQKQNTNVLNVLNWSSYIPDEVIKDFEKETNIKELYSSCFPKIFGKKINSDSTSYHIEKADFAYSYMWMSMLHILVFQLS